MADAKTLISLGLKDEASRQLKQFEGNYQKAIGGIEGADSGSGAGLAQIAVEATSLSGALTMLGATAPQILVATKTLELLGGAVDMARLASEGQRLEGAYQSLAAKTGVAAHTMLAAMRSASYGMISDMGLMQAANSAMALGVVDSADEMAALLQVAIAKGAEFNIAPAQALNDLINGLGRMSPEILNNIGIVVNAKQAYDAYAATLGTTASRLTEQQRMQALVNSVLAATPDAAQRSAEIGQSGAAAFDRWGAATANASQIWGATFLPAVATGLNWLTMLVDALGKLGDAMNEIGAAGAGGINWTPAKIETQIAKIEKALAAYQDPKQYPQTAQTQMLVASATAQLTDLKAMLAEMTAAGAGTASAISSVGHSATQAGSGLSVAETQAARLKARLGELAGQSDATLGSLRSMWVGAAGALGAGEALAGLKGQQQELAALEQGWYYMGLTSEQIEFEKAAWIDHSSEKLRQQTQALTTLGTAASGAGSAVTSMQSSLQSNLSSMVGSQLSGALTMDVAWPGQQGPRPDAINENARRLAAIANEGLTGQDWLGQFAQEAPATYADLMLKIAEGMDAQGAAQLLLTQFQSGLRPDLLNFDLIKEQVKQQLLGQQAIEQMTGEITSQLMAEMGVNAGQVQSALGAVTGMAGGAASAGELETGFTEGLDATGAATGALAKIAKAFLDQEGSVRSAGGVVGAWWGEGFLAVVGDNIPPTLLDLLTNLVTPLVQARLSVQASTTGTSDGS